MPSHKVEVKCYSGHTYAERPQSFLWHGRGFKVKSIETEWLEPVNKYFRVLTEDEKVFELCYNVAQDEWRLTCQD